MNRRSRIAHMVATLAALAVGMGLPALAEAGFLSRGHAALLMGSLVGIFAWALCSKE